MNRKISFLLSLLLGFLLVQPNPVFCAKKEKPGDAVRELVKKARKASKESRKQMLDQIRNAAPKDENEITELLENVGGMGDEKDWDYNEALMESLGKIKDKKHSKLFRQYLKKGKPFARGMAIQKIKEFNDSESVPDLVEIVRTCPKVKRMKENEDSLIGMQAADVLGDMQDERAIPVLIENLGKLDGHERKALSKFGKKIFKQLLEIRRNSKDDEESSAAYGAICMMTDKNVIPELWKLLQDDPVKNTFASTLLKLTDETTTPTRQEVEKFIYDHAKMNPILQGDALLLAMRTNNTTYLIGIAQNEAESESSRTSAIRYLGQLKCQKAVPILLNLLENGKRSIGGAAETALWRITGQKYEWKPK